MKTKLLLLLATILLLASCSETQTETKPKEPEKPCVYDKVEIKSTKILWKSWNDNSQSAWAAAWIEWWAMVWCVMWWPIGCVVGGILWAAGWVWLGSLDKSVDYEVQTDKGVFICQWEECENLEEKVYIKKDNTLTSIYCTK